MISNTIKIKLHRARVPSIILMGPKLNRRQVYSCGIDLNLYGARKNFDRDARVIFFGLKFDKLLFLGVVQNEGCFFFLGGGELKKYYYTHYFFRVDKKFAVFLGVAEKINCRINS